MKSIALGGVAQLLGSRPVHQKVAVSIPRQSTCLGYGLDPQWGVCNKCYVLT